MKVEQISIFIENKAGRLAEVSGVLCVADIHIRALSLADTSDFGILRLIVDRGDRAMEVLKEKGFTVSKTEVIAVEVPDSPDGLHRVLTILEDGGVNIEYLYAFVEPGGSDRVIIFRFDDSDEALSVLIDHDVKVLEGRRVYGLRD